MALSSFFTEMVLPFLLVFVVVFAILQKSKILGENKSQIDALTALAIALLLIGLPQPRDIVVGIMPWLAVGLAVLLVFFLLYGFVAGDLSTGDGGNMPKGLQYTIGALAGVFTIGVVIYVTGLWDWLEGLFDGGDTSSLLYNVLFIIIVIGAVAFAFFTSKKKNDG